MEEARALASIEARLFRHTMSCSDFDLLERWREGDEIAGNRLVRRHFGPLYRFFRTKVSDDLAQDLTQQSLLGMVEGRDRFRQEASFKSYLFAIARLQLLLSLRSHYRAGKVFAPEHVSVQEMGGTSSVTAGTMAVAHYEQRLLLAALRQIPLDFQIVVELHYWEGMTVTEIAAVIEVAPGTVKSRLSRSRAMLQEHISKLAGQSGVQIQPDDLDRWVNPVQDMLAQRPNEGEPPSPTRPED